MGITSKAFQKLNGMPAPVVAKTKPMGALPSRNFGGLGAATAHAVRSTAVA